METRRGRIDSVPLVGGRPCLDLVNSVSWRGRAQAEEHLVDDAACLIWARRTGILTGDEAEALAGRAVRIPLVRLRTALEQHLAEPSRASGLAVLQPHVDDALRHSALEYDETGAAHWQVRDLDARAPARRVTLDLLDLLVGPPGPIATCDDPECGWFFVDTSRGHRRRWCDSADCGNRARVRRHAERRASRRD